MAENIGEFGEMLANLSPLTLQDLCYPFTKHFPPKTLIAECFILHQCFLLYGIMHIIFSKLNVMSKVSNNICSLVSYNTNLLSI